MNWLDRDIMNNVREVCMGRTYGQAASLLSEQYGEYITAEQLRSALRRFKQRDVVQEARASLAPTIVQPIKTVKQGAFQRLPIEYEFTFGAVGDSHMCSNWERNDILESLYDTFEDRGVETVFHTGNWIDGEASFNQHEIHTHGIDGQCQYFVDNYPRREGIITKFVDGGDHENWWTQKHGINVGKHAEDLARRAGRNDLQYLGFMEADVDMHGVVIRVLHAGGGSSYALSHTSQKIIDSYEEYERPDILLIGHYHKAHFLPYYRGVAVIQTGTTQEATPFMKKKRLHADLGGWVVTIGLNSEGAIGKLQAEFVHYRSNAWRS